ncbi:integrase core domain-containing protein [Propionibacterium acidifaciens]|uniref:integrase core domain-containing protein n=1 Tax=Propionibacterium acidifaciens TaxID=556499 RepID=UPI0036F240A7
MTTIYSNLAGIRPPGGRHGLLLGEGSSGARSPVACAPDSSPGPRPWPRRARPPIRGVTVFHSDRGARCAWAGCTGFMTGRGVLPSVGRTGGCCGSAVAESFNAILKKELVNRKVYSTRNHAIRDVTAWTGSRCNHRRLHSAIDYQTPNQVDTEWRQQHKAAA